MSCCSYSRAGARQTSPPASTAPDEFLCPICGFLMEDPVAVITSAGHTFDRACIEACIELSHTPPILSSPPSPPLVPNLNLKAAILRWCLRSGHRPPFPVSRQEARGIVEGLMMGSADQSPQHNQDQEEEDDEDVHGGWDQEERIFKELTEASDSAKVDAMEELYGRITTTIGDRAAACSPRLMAAIVPRMWFDYGAVYVVRELAEEPANAIKIVGCGAVPPLLRALAEVGPNDEYLTRAHAACALGLLTGEGRCLRIMAALGAAAPLSEAFFLRRILTGNDDRDIEAQSWAGTALDRLIDAARLFAARADTEDPQPSRVA